MSQKDDILRYMREEGSITPVDALRNFGCMRLAARIDDAKREGWDIETEPESGKNRFGKTVRFARYSLRIHDPEQLELNTCATPAGTGTVVRA